jgi:hypothetical protein
MGSFTFKDIDFMLVFVANCDSGVFEAGYLLVVGLVLGSSII